MGVRTSDLNASPGLSFHDNVNAAIVCNTSFDSICIHICIAPDDLGPAISCCRRRCTQLITPLLMAAAAARPHHDEEPVIKSPLFRSHLPSGFFIRDFQFEFQNGPSNTLRFFQLFCPMFLMRALPQRRLFFQLFRETIDFVASGFR
jgi:hypothetical protein